MYYFNDMLGTDYSNVLVAIDDASSTNSDVHRIVADAWAISEADDTAGALPVFSTFIDYVFKTNGVDVVVSTNDLANPWGTTNLDDVTTLIPRYCCVWEDRLYLANERSNPYPSRIYWSGLPAGAPLALPAWDAGDYADINPDDNDEITWIEPFGPRLLVFKNRGLYRWTFGQVEPDKIIDVGTPQGRTVKQTHGICFFANRYGVWTYQGGQPKLISRKMQPFINAISDLTAIRAEVDNDHYYLYIGDVTVDSISYSNVMLVYTISLDAWHFETYPFEITSMARFLENTLGTTTIYDSIYLGDNDGYVYRKGTGTVDYKGITEQPINGLIQSKEYPVNFPNGAQLNQLTMIAQQASGLKVNYRVDRFPDFKPWYDLQKRITKAKLGGRAETIQLEFTDNSKIQSVIEGFDIEFGSKEEKRRKKDGHSDI